MGKFRRHDLAEGSMSLMVAVVCVWGGGDYSEGSKDSQHSQFVLCFLHEVQVVSSKLPTPTNMSAMLPLPLGIITLWNHQPK